MTHWTVLPVVMPAMLAAAMVLTMRYHLTLERIFSLAGTVVLLVVAAGLAWRAGHGTIDVYELGSWRAPFGIVLVADRLSTLMVLLTALLALGVVVYAIGSGWDTRGRHFHPLFQFQLMGICGAFLTGDAFNLFVFFEVLLIASYGLMIHSGGGLRLRAGTQYVVYNLLGSTLFLFALGTLYAITGTLNMADLAVKIAALPAEDTALIRVGGTLLLLVFAIKAAILPLHFWLPESYSRAPAPVAAQFAIMTKVGVYAIIRMYTMVFPPELEAVSGLYSGWLLPASVLTLAVGMIGVLAAARLERLVAFAVIGSVGTLLVAVSLFTQEATAVALYYLIHSTLATALLFLVTDLVARGRGRTDGCPIEVAPAVPQQGMVASLFFLGAIAIVGLPPLSGFVGKLMVLDAARAAPNWGLIWAVMLPATLLAVIGFSRAGSTIFWKCAALDPDEEPREAPLAPAIPALPLVAVTGFAVSLAALTVLAGPLMVYLGMIAEQLYAPQAYIEAVLGPDPGVAP